MRSLILLAILLSSTATAANSPDTLSLLKTWPKWTSITQSESLSGADDDNHYTISFCPDGQTCDVFQAKPAELKRLADYAYLYALYAAKYEDDTGQLEPVIAKGQQDGSGQALLKFYNKDEKCKTGDKQAACILQSILKSAGIKRYSSNGDEGGTFYSLEEGGPE